jgi:hypothetical protein
VVEGARVVGVDHESAYHAAADGEGEGQGRAATVAIAGPNLLFGVGRGALDAAPAVAASLDEDATNVPAQPSFVFRPDEGLVAPTQHPVRADLAPQLGVGARPTELDHHADREADRDGTAK